MPPHVEAASRRDTAPLPNIWIVDDSPLEAELVRRALASVYDVQVFTDGAAVIEQLANEPPPDAIVLDWQMPGVSGIEVCQFLRTRPQTQAIPILVLTIHRDTQDLVRCLGAGADDFLSKPYNPAELSARVAALVRTKQMHERVLSAERDVRTLLMQLPEGVLSVDARGRVTFANVAAQEMLGADDAGVLGKALRDLLPGIALDRALVDVAVGDRILSPAIRRYAGVDATQTTLSLRDVTAERFHERQRSELLAAERAARAQAEEASRAKDDFLAVVSHELRTPLNAILGWTRLVRAGALDEEKRTRALETIERNAVAQQKLIEDILDVSRIISGKMVIATTAVDLAQAARRSVDAIRPAAEAKTIDLKIDVEAEPRVLGDAGRLQQVVSNVLSNAVKFTQRAGSIAVRVTVEGNDAVVRVADSGQGIAPELLPHVFDRFRQGDTGTSRAQNGLGLGLSIVQHLLDLHRGSVRADSAGVGKGTTVTIRLPTAATDDEPVTEARAFAIVPPGKTPARSLEGVRVLVVDDERDARDLLQAMFDQLDAKPTAVASVPEAMQAIAEVRPQVVISDIGMPVEDGYAFIARLRALPVDEGGATPAVALTAFAAPRDGARAIAAGFNVYLPKPVDLAQLAGVVAELAWAAPER